jgi:hypothetical protein
MFTSSIRSLAKRGAVGPPTLSALSTQTRSLYFCGPKHGDHDPDLPISQHYHACSRTTDSEARSIAQYLLAPTPPIRPTATTATATTAETTQIPTLRISVTHAPPNLPARHTISSINKPETSKKAIEQLEAATHDEATSYNTAIVIIQEIARLEFMLRKAELEGKQSEDTEKIREDIEGMKSLFNRLERKM